MIMEVDVAKIVSIMIGRLQGKVTRLKEETCPQILAYHCIIHQTVLCAGLGDSYKTAMNTIIKLVNYTFCCSLPENILSLMQKYIH